MELGYNKHPMIDKNLNDILEIASKERFSIIEILSKGPY